MIHPTALIGKDVKLADDVEIGPFSVLRGKVTVGSGTRIESHTVIGCDHGEVVIGSNNHILSAAMIGGIPQDLSYKNEPTRLEIGDSNTFREFVTVNVGTTKGGGVTRIGNHGLYMAYVHVAHDCQIGDHVVVANTCNFAGHVTVEDHVRIGGACSFAQFLTVGKYSYLGGGSIVNKDVLPCTIAQGNFAVSRATNKIGLERAGISKEEIESVHRAVRALIMGERTVDEALAFIEKECASLPLVQHIVQFVKNSEKGIAR